jgi:hypothetical protein
MAGVMALINQKTGSIQGNPNAEFYKLAAKQSYSSCSAETVANTSGCYFNDIDAGNISIGSTIIPNNNSVPCDYATLSPNCYIMYPGESVGILGTGTAAGNPGYNAGTGYDLATGLGSLNVANVVNSFVGIGSHPALVTVSPAQISITANQSLSVKVTVSSAYTGGGTPTGTVTLSGGGYTSAVETLNASGECTFTILGDTLSAGADIVLTASYSGDATYASESNTATVSVIQLTPGMSVSAPSTLNSNYPLTVAVTLSATGTGGTPRGTVTLSAPGYTSAATPINASGVATIIIPANTFTSTGSITLSASYSGDPTYISDVGTASVAVTYVPVLTPQMTVVPASTSANSDDALNVTATVTGASAAEASPTGTVMLTVTLQGSNTALYTSSAEPLSGGVYLFTIPANSFSAGSGTYVLTVSYSGDPIYHQISISANVLVAESDFTLTAPATTPIISVPGKSETVAITVTAVAGYTGTANFTFTSCQLTSGPANSSADTPICTAAVETVAMGGTETLTVNTTSASSAALAYSKLPGKGWAGAGGGAVLALLLFLGMPARRRSWRSMLGLLLVMAALGGLSSCGGGSSIGGGNPTDPGTAAGTYLFTVTATGNPAVTSPPSVSFTVSVN